MKNFTFTKGMTHGGVFHADEVFVVAAIRLMTGNEDFPIERTFKVPENVPEDTFVFDIGYGEYDHHQKGGNGTRTNGVPYASAGLFWRDYAGNFVTDYVQEIVDRDLVQGIDAIDNGHLSKTEGETCPMTVSGIVSGFNPTWDSERSTDDAFEDAVLFMQSVLSNAINSAASKEKARATVESAYLDMEDGIVILPYFVPWQDHLLEMDTDEEAIYVVFPSNRGGYNLQQVPKTAGGTEGRLPLPEEWAGLRDKELEEVSGVEGATFCHPGRFIAGAETKAAALKLARKALERK